VDHVTEPLCDAILSKIHEQIERTDHLITILTPEQLNWTPEISGAWRTATILGHLLDCLAGICAVLMAVQPEKLAYFHRLRETRIETPRTVREARDGPVLYQKHIDAGFAALEDADLARRVPTAFVKSGESVLTLLLGNLEHLINHKHQLFMYLKLMGVNVSSQDLYRFRTEV
jgi:hypothetical protein